MPIENEPNSVSADKLYKIAIKNKLKVEKVIISQMLLVK